MKRILPLFVVLTFALSSYSQTNTDTTTQTSQDEQTMYTIRQNAVCMEDLLVYSYERLLPVSPRSAIGLKAGFLIWDPFMPLGEVSLVHGGSKNFFEAGAGGLIDVFEGGGFFTLRVGYRYLAPKGFIFKASTIYSPDNFLLPLIGIGYAF